jgi:hypothetical protein
LCNFIHADITDANVASTTTQRHSERATPTRRRVGEDRAGRLAASDLLAAGGRDDGLNPTGEALQNANAHAGPTLFAKPRRPRLTSTLP